MGTNGKPSVGLLTLVSTFLVASAQLSRCSKQHAARVLSSLPRVHERLACVLPSVLAALRGVENVMKN